MHVRRSPSRQVTLQAPQRRPTLHVAIDERGIVCLFGELDSVGCERLEAALEGAETARPLQLDLGGVTFIDSAGLRTLILLALSERGAGRRVVIEHPSPVVVRLMTLTGVTGLFDL